MENNKGWKDVAKKIATDTLGEDSAEALGKYGKAAIDAGKKAAKKVGDTINESQNETVVKARNLASNIKSAMNEPSPNASRTTPAQRPEIKIISVTCPNCGSSLLIRKGVDSFYCPHCESTSLIQNQSKEVLKAKVQEKKIEEKSATAEKVIDSLNKRSERKAEAAREKRKRNKVIIPILLGLIVIFMGLLFVHMKMQEKKSLAEEAQLQILAEEIQTDIDNGNWDSALIKANQLQYTTNYSSDVKRKWNNTRNAFIDVIEDHQRQLREEAEAAKAAEEAAAEAAFWAEFENEESETEITDFSEAAEDTTEQFEQTPKEVYSRDDRQQAFKKIGAGEYDIYYLFDFDAQKVYYFTSHESSYIATSCGDDPSEFVLGHIITFNGGDSVWQESITISKTTMTMKEANGAKYNFKRCPLDEAIALKDSMTESTHY